MISRARWKSRAGRFSTYWRNSAWPPARLTPVRWKNMRPRRCARSLCAVRGLRGRPVRRAPRGSQGIAPKIDLSRISKPGDVLKAILAKKQEAEAEAKQSHLPKREPAATPAQPPVKAAPPTVPSLPPAAPPARNRARSFRSLVPHRPLSLLRQLRPPSPPARRPSWSLPRLRQALLWRSVRPPSRLLPQLQWWSSRPPLPLTAKAKPLPMRQLPPRKCNPRLLLLHRPARHPPPPPLKPPRLSRLHHSRRWKQLPHPIKKQRPPRYPRQ